MADLMAVPPITVRASTPDSGQLRPAPSGFRRFVPVRRPSGSAVALAAATILLLCTAVPPSSTVAAVMLRFGALMAGIVLLSAVLGMVVQEQRTSAQRTRWTLEHRRLSEATRELRVRVEELAASAAAPRPLRGQEDAVRVTVPDGDAAGESGGIRLGAGDAGAGPARGRTGGLAPSPRLREEVQRVIRTYPLPIVYPWAKFERFVGDEIERCRVLLIVFSIIEIRMEDGATAGTDSDDRDLALRRVVDVLQASLRRVDVLSYDGTGRFAVLLPRMRKVHAVDKARELIARLETDHVATGLLRCARLALGAGVVTFPQDGARASELLGGIQTSWSARRS